GLVQGNPLKARLPCRESDCFGLGDRMNRRAFMLLAAAATIDRNPAAAEAKMPRIGFIQAGFRQDNQGLLDSFGQALAALGWTDSSTIVVLDRWAEERTERLPAIAKELIGSGVRVLVTAGTPAMLAARRASTTMPIVMVGVGDPVGLGVVASLGQPGGNVTGLSLTSPELTSEQLALLRTPVVFLYFDRLNTWMRPRCHKSAVNGQGKSRSVAAVGITATSHLHRGRTVRISIPPAASQLQAPVGPGRGL